MKHLNIRSFQRSVLSVSRSRRRRLPFLTGITLLLYHLYRFGKQKTDRKFIDSITETLGLQQRLDALPGQLSGGQQQRVAIARALAAAPAIILADEPTGNLDGKTSQDVLSLLKVTSRKYAQTIVMITHNEEIAQLADRIIRIEDGRIIK